MMSGDKCDMAGIYWASGCGHADAMEFSEYDVFPVCKTYGHPIKWILKIISQIQTDTLPEFFGII
jgi:hypothetical protein